MSLSPLGHASFSLRPISAPFLHQNCKCPTYMFANVFERRKELICTSCSKSFFHIHTDHLSSSPKIASDSSFPSSSPISHLTSLLSPSSKQALLVLPLSYLKTPFISSNLHTKQTLIKQQSTKEKCFIKQTRVTWYPSSLTMSSFFSITEVLKTHVRF